MNRRRRQLHQSRKVLETLRSIQSQGIQQDEIFSVQVHQQRSNLAEAE
jgi:hypothetical protein